MINEGHLWLHTLGFWQMICWYVTTKKSNLICLSAFGFCTISLNQGLQTTACGPNLAHEAISSGPRRHFVNNEKTACLQ